jgi:flagellar protein FlaG
VHLLPDCLGEIAMSATPLNLDVNPPLARGTVTNRREGGEVQTQVQTVVAKEGENGKNERKVKEETSQKSVANVNLLSSGLEFSQDQETGLTVIKMYDRETGKLVRQLPPEETLNFLRQLAENQKGVLVSKKL